MDEKEKRRQDKQGGKRKPLKKYVVYVYSVCMVECSTDTEKEAALFGVHEVRSALHHVDNNIHIGKIAVIEEDDDEEQKKNLANGQVPWIEAIEAAGPTPAAEAEDPDPNRGDDESSS